MLIHINQITIYVQIEARAFEFQNATFNVFGFFFAICSKSHTIRTGSYIIALAIEWNNWNFYGNPI